MKDVKVRIFLFIQIDRKEVVVFMMVLLRLWYIDVLFMMMHLVLVNP
jgi:hypothetical protein